MSLIGDINLDTDLIMKLNDRELGMVCQVNRKARQICNSPLLWRKRLEYFFPLDNDKIDFILEHYTFTLKELYIMLRNASNFRLMIKWLEEIPKEEKASFYELTFVDPNLLPLTWSEWLNITDNYKSQKYKYISGRRYHKER